MKHLANGLLIAASILVAGLVAEGTTRLIDGLPLFTDWLPNTVDRDVSTGHHDEIPRAAGVSRNWYFDDPPPLPNRHEIPEDWVRLAREIGEAPNWIGSSFRPADAFKAWNSVAAATPCQHPLLRQAPGRLYVYQSTDGSEWPRFRFMPNATTPLNLVTNQLGWRGPPIEIQKAAKVIRIAFVGASTTVNSHYYPYSYPEFLGHWLNLWAASRKLDVRFEAMNAGRESAISTDIEAIVRKEVLPLRPDLIVYYEGANQFVMNPMLKRQPDATPERRGQVAPESGFARLLRDLSNRSALARRLQAALGLVGNPGRGDEWSKPEYDLQWPAGLDEKDPDLSRRDLPVNLPVILGDLDRIRADLAGSQAELVVSSYARFVQDGMVLDPIRNRALIDHLNIAHFPFRYRDIERLTVFQNRVFAKYAAAHGLPFLDIAGQIPKAADLFTDAVHLSYGGVRLHGWIALQGIVQLAEKRLASGVWPRPVAPASEPPPGLLFTPREVTFSCPAG